eukprot:TRINITY_DN3952_c0_g1_i1.p1 TRINITY_DN3952_c0_g1~~TRINITY_DN3952_c0_g1_i1.p1  ORF type:complete len:150 (+),score=15.63 TRINITY_DN3952_c0_g1_i1:38-451(+)
MAPETLTDRRCFKVSDIWSLGCIIYEMLCGCPPFHDASELLTFEKIINEEPILPKNIPEEAKDIILLLLVKDPTKRLGFKDYEDIKTHPFFRGIDWQNLSNITPPAFRPFPEKLLWEEKKQLTFSGRCTKPVDDNII